LARAIKNNKKKGRPLKFFIHRSKLQAGISEEIQHTEAGVSASSRRFCSANWPEHAVVGLGCVTAPINRDSLWPSSSEVPACNLDRWMKNFIVRLFFSCFFIARANQKIRILALGRHSSYGFVAVLRFVSLFWFSFSSPPSYILDSTTSSYLHHSQLLVNS
jgi:hypothetical protein